MPIGNCFRCLNGGDDWIRCPEAPRGSCPGRCHVDWEIRGQRLVTETPATGLGEVSIVGVYRVGPENTAQYTPGYPTKNPLVLKR